MYIHILYTYICNIYIYRYVCTHVYIEIYICMYACTNIYVYIYIHIYIHIYMCIYAYIYRCVYMYVPLYLCAPRHMSTRVYWGVLFMYYVYIQVPWVFFERALKQEFDTLDQDTLNAIKMELDVNANQQIGHSCVCMRLNEKRAGFVCCVRVSVCTW